MLCTSKAGTLERVIRAVVALMILGVAIDELSRPLLAIPLLVAVGVLARSVFTGKCYIPFSSSYSPTTAPHQQDQGESIVENPMEQHVSAAGQNKIADDSRA
ncbi:DUF2892 domain-containing protein [Timonella senegalensis]|uniref:YgaP family membrane protein n=1 Tax=Timonella senegalensis TaxID=1465825 RepID=UPI002FDDFF54